jgi:enterochelin esterase-like enzyme
MQARALKEAMKYLLVLLQFFAMPAFAGGTLTPNIRISSDVLGYELQYRAYLPDGFESRADLPVIFLTDGAGYIRQGHVPSVMDRLIQSARIEPVVAIFVDARDPNAPNVNRRNEQFFCNEDYLNFFITELIPAIEKKYPVAREREKRTILGLSFGGLNAACFGLMGANTFSGIGMHSPANHPVPGLLNAYEELPAQPLKIFLSTGSPNDNTRANREFRNVLKAKGYELKYVETREGHDWKNWRQLIDDVLLYFYAATSADT